MKFNSPLPQPLAKECLKAAAIFNSFVDNRNNGLDGVIPRSILEEAKGFAIFTIFKAGFVLSARAGSGVVIAKLDDGRWSAPSAIGSAGLGVGSQAGAEVTDFLVVLNSRSAVRSFMAAGSLTLGGNMSIALGPLGRNGEATGAVNTNGKVAAMYSYSKTRGLFGGVSVEGSVIVERQDANVQAYNSPVTAKMLLGGVVDPPSWAMSLIKTLESCTGMPGNRDWIQDGNCSPGGPYIFGGMASPSTTPNGSSFLRKKKGDQSPYPPASWGAPLDSGSYFSESPGRPPRNLDWDVADPRTRYFETQFESNFNPQQSLSKAPSFQASSRSSLDTNPFASSGPNRIVKSHLHARSSSLYTPSFRTHPPVSSPAEPDFYSPPPHDPFAVSRSNSLSPRNVPYIKPKPELMKTLLPNEGVARGIALYDFVAVEAGDLSFVKGDVITITQKSNSNDDWWTGKLHDKEGIFPANFVEVV